MYLSPLPLPLSLSLWIRSVGFSSVLVPSYPSILSFYSFLYSSINRWSLLIFFFFNLLVSSNLLMQTWIFHFLCRFEFVSWSSICQSFSFYIPWLDFLLFLCTSALIQIWLYTKKGDFWTCNPFQVLSLFCFLLILSMLF